MDDWTRKSSTERPIFFLFVFPLFSFIVLAQLEKDCRVYSGPSKLLNGRWIIQGGKFQLLYSSAQFASFNREKNSNPVKQNEF